VLLQRHPGLQTIAKRLALPAEQLGPLATFLLAIHDLGKFSRMFQAKVPELFPPALGELPKGVDPGHAKAARLFWDTVVRGDLDSFGIEAEPFALTALAYACFGHHGEPVSLLDDRTARSLFGQGGLAATRTFIETCVELFLGDALIELDENRARRTSFAFAGLAVLADWIGSKQDWFPYEQPSRNLADYWQACAMPRAERAVREAGVLPARPRAMTGYRELTGRIGFTPTPMQRWAETVAIPDGPALFVIEDETGSGKTEAALMLAHRLIAAGRAYGLYIGLPTQATANAMFDRLGASYRNLFDVAARPSLALAHGSRDLHPGFRAAVIPAGRREGGYDGDDAPENVTASAACAAWIADDRRRTFQADVGVGTVDQAILAVLPSRFQSLRLLGLGQRVLILDEIHAYDDYIQTELATLLEFQAAQGGCAILLSATLPATMRRKLIAAFRKGLGDDPANNATACAAYPLASVAAHGYIGAEPSGPRARPWRPAAVPVRFLRSPGEALAEAERALGEGRSVLYVRNAVDDAIEAAQALRDRGLSPLLFHARFALCDRLRREAEVMSLFGARRIAGTPRILVATQVVEQSLDLDFDLIISDLAPVDLLIQRAGRLWRRERAGRSGPCEFLVVSPDPVETAELDWFARDFRRGAAVYPNHALLWLSARELKARGCIPGPDGLRDLIESVYSEDAMSHVPAALSRRWIEAEGRAGAAKAIARSNVLNPAAGYAREGGRWDEDVRTPTRLGEEQTTLRLARLENGRIVPWAADHFDARTEDWRLWRLSEAQVLRTRVIGEANWQDELRPMVAAAKAAWSKWDDDIVLVLLEPAAESGFWRGAARGPKGQLEIFYDTLGLRF
jgi:CRISPR-associated endonuclease/helicase Cas3